MMSRSGVQPTRVVCIVCNCTFKASRLTHHPWYVFVRMQGVGDVTADAGRRLWGLSATDEES